MLPPAVVLLCPRPRLPLPPARSPVYAFSVPTPLPLCICAAACSARSPFARRPLLSLTCGHHSLTVATPHHPIACHCPHRIASLLLSPASRCTSRLLLSSADGRIRLLLMTAAAALHCLLLLRLPLPHSLWLPLAVSADDCWLRHARIALLLDALITTAQSQRRSARSTMPAAASV
jgi:hypothetical protein